MTLEPRFRRRPGERAPEILDAAMELFAERGFELTRIVDVASRASVSHGTVGSYFPTKEALLHGVVERMAEPEMERVLDLISEFEGTTAALLETLGLFWCVNRRPKGTPYRRAKGTPFVEQRDGYDGRAVRAGCGVGRA